MASAKAEVRFVPKRGTEYKPMKASVKYHGVKISAATNRPVKEGEPAPKVDVYWCEPCQLKLTNPMATLVHYTSNQHYLNLEAFQKDGMATGDRKRKYDYHTGAARGGKFPRGGRVPRGGYGGTMPFDNSRQGFNDNMMQRPPLQFNSRPYNNMSPNVQPRMLQGQFHRNTLPEFGSFQGQPPRRGFWR